MIDMEAFLADAVAQAAKKALKKQAQFLASKGNRQKLIADNRKKKEAESQKKHLRRGKEIAEDFLQQIAGPFIRMMDRDDACKLQSIKIHLRPYKGDHGPYSFHLETNDGSYHFPNGSIRELAGKAGWEPERIIAKIRATTVGGFDCSSPTEMLEEILRLRLALAKTQEKAEVSEELHVYFEGDEETCPECERCMKLTNDDALILNGGEVEPGEDHPSVAQVCGCSR